MHYWIKPLKRSRTPGFFCSDVRASLVLAPRSIHSCHHGFPNQLYRHRYRRQESQQRSHRARQPLTARTAAGILYPSPNPASTLGRLYRRRTVDAALARRRALPLPRGERREQPRNCHYRHATHERRQHCLPIQPSALMEPQRVHGLPSAGTGSAAGRCDVLES